MRSGCGWIAAVCLMSAGTWGGAWAQCPPDPMPTGPTVEPGVAMSVQEYAFVHSSTNLQGNPCFEKIAPGLFWNPRSDFGSGIPRIYGGFSSAVIVNNPFNNQSTTVLIDYFSPSGQLLATTGPHFIGPDGTHYEDASPLGSPASSLPGLGSAVVRVVDPTVDAPIVGATLHYFDTIGVPGWGVVADPDSIIIPGTGHPIPGPGEGSYQQLQMTQYFTPLFGGPYRITNVSPSDFDNGSIPLFLINNPNGAAKVVTISALAVGPAGIIGSLSTRTVTLAAHGMMLDDSFWQAINRATAIAAATLTFDFSIAILAVTSDGTPLMGEALVIDVFGDGPATMHPQNLLLGRKMRMVSSSLANTPTDRLVATDISTHIPAGGTVPMIDTGVHVLNAGFNPTGPVLVEYFDRLGTPLTPDVLAGGLAAGATLHIGMGQPQTPNFPGPSAAMPAGIWNGWLRVTAGCDGDTLIGWTHREILPAPPPPYWHPQYQYYKAYGEEMTGQNGAEPGWGISLVGLPSDPAFANVPFARKVMPLVRTWSFSFPPYWPGYTTFANDQIMANLGLYYYRFFELLGTDATNYFAYSPPLAGLAWGSCSLSYEDSDPAPYTQLSLLFANMGNGSGRVDRGTGYPDLAWFDGINVLGDPFGEFNIGQFARRGYGPPVATPVDPVDADRKP